ncbi:unnamed protein product, partial [Pylaiella littoralis]
PEVWRGRYQDGGVLLWTRQGWNGGRPPQAVCPLHQEAEVWRGRYENGGVLLWTRQGWNGERPQKAVCPPRLHQEAEVWRGRYEDGGVLLWTRQGWNGGRLPQAVCPPRLHQEAEVWCGRYEDGGVLLWTRHGWNGGRPQQAVCPPLCTKQPRYGVAGTKTAEFCSGHAKDGMVDVLSKRCAHLGCTKRPSYGVAGTQTAEFCSGHAKDGMVRVSDSRNPCSVRGRSGGARGCGGAEMDGCTARRSGAGGKKRRRSLADTRQAEPSSESSSRSGRADSKRSRQATVNTPVSPPPSIGGTAEYETHAAPDANVSLPEPDDAAVKTEVATVSSKAVAIEALPAVETTAGESATSVGYNLCAEPDGSVKTEVGI